MGYTEIYITIKEFGELQVIGETFEDFAGTVEITKERQNKI